MNTNAIGMIDGVVLQTATVSSTGSGTAFSTAGMQSLSITATGVEACSIQINGSNDQSSWQPLMLVQSDTLDAIDTIYTSGNYSLQVTTLYVKYVCTLVVGSLTLTFVGRSSEGLSASGKIAMAMNPELNYPLNVAIQSGLKVDSNKAIIPSDAEAPIIVTLAVGQVYTFDTTGYQTLSISSSGMAASVASSNDGQTFITQNGVTSGSSGGASLFAANQTFICPCLMRWIRITATTGGTFTAYLRNTVSLPSNQNVNVVSFGGTPAATAGVAGTIAVGGNIAAGVAPTLNPIGVGGVDPGGLTRRIATDTAGNTIAVGHDPIGSASTVNPVQIGGVDPSGMARRLLTDWTGRIQTQDSSALADDGSRVLDLIAAMLTELKIISQILYESKMGTLTPADDPTTFRNDVSFVNQ